MKKRKQQKPPPLCHPHLSPKSVKTASFSLIYLSQIINTRPPTQTHRHLHYTKKAIHLALHEFIILLRHLTHYTHNLERENKVLENRII